MRILHVTNNYTPYNGGVVHAINSLLKSQMSNNTVGLVTFDFKATHTLNDGSFVYRLWSPLHFTYKNNPMILPYNVFNQLAHIIINFRPTIIHTHHPFLLGPVAQKIGESVNCPVVFTYHTWYTQYVHYSPYRGAFIEQKVQSLVDNFCKKVDGIIAPSNAVFNSLQSKEVKRNSAVIPSPIADRFFRKRIPKQLCRGRKIRLLSLSRFTHEKNLFALFEICTFLQTANYEIVIAGFGYLEEQLRKTAYHDYKFSPQSVQFVSNPSTEKIDFLYDWADLFLFTSVSDTQGLVLAEALARQTPALCLEGPGQKDIIKNGHNGFCLKNPKEIALMIQNLHHNTTLLNFLIDNGIESSNQYRKEIVATKIMNFYQSCL